MSLPHITCQYCCNRRAVIRTRLARTKKQFTRFACKECYSHAGRAGRFENPEPVTRSDILHRAMEQL